MVILMACIFYRLPGEGRAWVPVKVGLLGIGLALLMFYAQGTLAYFNRAEAPFGYGYMDNIHFWNAEIAVLKSLDPARSLITNDPQLLYALCERYSYALPSEVSQDVGDTSAETEDTLRQKLMQGALLVMISGHGDPAANTLADQLIGELALLADTSHVKVYAAAP